MYNDVKYEISIYVIQIIYKYNQIYRCLLFILFIEIELCLPDDTPIYTLKKVMEELDFPILLANCSKKERNMRLFMNSRIKTNPRRTECSESSVLCCLKMDGLITL